MLLFRCILLRQMFEKPICENFEPSSAVFKIEYKEDVDSDDALVFVTTGHVVLDFWQEVKLS
jgi:hypothetical protein